MATTSNGVSTEIVQEIIEALGGAENILAATHCITRLRLVL
jgi:PTS system trehalose-specific IIC component